MMPIQGNPSIRAPMRRRFNKFSGTGITYNGNAAGTSRPVWSTPRRKLRWIVLGVVILGALLAWQHFVTG